MNRFEVVTFDCYGTLIDWEGGISAAFHRAAARDGVTLTRDAVLAAYAEEEPKVESEAYRSYAAVLTETARRVAARLGWPLAADRARFLADSIADWQPFLDTNPALERLAAAGYRLGILSNVDDALLAATRRHFGVPFEIVVTAEQVRSYKPAPAHFLEARKRIGPSRWLHAAQSYYHDIIPARALGIPTAWINRHTDLPLDGGTADYEFTTLTEFADRLAPSA
jgi:2-haloacid dehalogenase/putative hydrolase of the HAD superfamily